MRKTMIVSYKDWIMGHSDPNLIGLPHVTTHANVEKFCCDRMKEKWTTEIGFCPNARTDFGGAVNPYLFWTLDFAYESIGSIGMLVGPRYGHEKDKIEECPFCHARIKFVEKESIRYD